MHEAIERHVEETSIKFHRTTVFEFEWEDGEYPNDINRLRHLLNAVDADWYESGTSIVVYDE